MTACIMAPSPDCELQHFAWLFLLSSNHVQVTRSNRESNDVQVKRRVGSLRIMAQTMWSCATCAVGDLGNKLLFLGSKPSKPQNLISVASFQPKQKAWITFERRNVNRSPLQNWHCQNRLMTSLPIFDMPLATKSTSGLFYHNELSISK